VISPTLSAAARRSLPSSAAHPRSLLARSPGRAGYALTHVSRACRVRTRVHVHPCTAPPTNGNLTTPDANTLGTGFVDWLRTNFSWLWATAQTNATLGNSYLYAEPTPGASQGSLPSWALLGEYGNGGASSTGRTEYLWLPTQDGQAIPIGLYRGGKLYAIQSDHLGTPRLITNETNTPQWQWPYSAFGDNNPTGILKPTTSAGSAFTSLPPSGSVTTTTLLATSTPAQINNLRFPGQYADSETGLFYNYFRSYQATQGRYTQNDPIGLAGGWNRFGYVEGNPLSMLDPEGLNSRGTVTPGGPGAQYRYTTLGGTVWGQSTHQHHSGPVFMGFPRNQELTPLTRTVHEQLHRDLNNYLRTQTNELGQHMRPQSNNSGRDIRENFSSLERWNSLREFYNRYGDQYPTAARDFFRQFPNQNFCGR
jgi:RHS repeat-associated protein